MATSQLSIAFPEQALSKSSDIFEVLLTDWGTDPSDRWPLSLVSTATVDQPTFPITPSGVCIGPRSTVDRAWLSWNTQEKWTQDIFGEAFSQFLSRPLSLEQPIYFAVPAKNTGTLESPLTNPIGTAMSRNLFYAFPQMPLNFPQATVPGISESTTVPAEYMTALGDVLPFLSGDWYSVTPLLHLQFLFKPGLTPPTKRLPWNVKMGQSAGSTPGVEVPIFQVPTFGRKHIHITCSGSEAGIAYRVGALRGLRNTTDPTYVQQESTEGLKGVTTAFAANEACHFHLCDPCADYVTLYATLTVALATSISFQVTATD